MSYIEFVHNITRAILSNKCLLGNIATHIIRSETAKTIENCEKKVT